MLYNKIIDIAEIMLQYIASGALTVGMIYHIPDIERALLAGVEWIQWLF